MRVGLWLVAFAGCDFTFNLDHIPDRSDARRDGSFDPTTDCPGYTFDWLPGSGSRYRIVTTPSTAWDANLICTGDRVGFTHLAVPQSASELAAIRGEVVARMQPSWWVGGVQAHDALTVNAGWMWVTEEAFDESRWTAPEPNDGGDGTENQAEQFTTVTPTGLADFTGSTMRQAVCECDGRGVTQAAAVAIADNRN